MWRGLPTGCWAPLRRSSRAAMEFSAAAGYTTIEAWMAAGRSLGLSGPGVYAEILLPAWLGPCTSSLRLIPTA